jgi:hypothetical protein
VHSKYLVVKLTGHRNEKLPLVHGSVYLEVMYPACQFDGIMSRRVAVAQGSVILTNEQMVNEYFRLISNRDVQGLLDLFAEDSVVYEPFSKEDGLHGKSTIEYFLKVAVMASARLKRTIAFVEKAADAITALVTFERGDSVKGRFSFLFAIQEVSGAKKIKELKIRFL